MTYWLLWQASEESHSGWEFQGLWSDEEKALAEARSHASVQEWWMAPAELDVPLPVEYFDWEGSYYLIDGKRVEVEWE